MEAPSGFAPAREQAYPELSYSAIHTEYRIENGRVRPLEIALRLGGGNGRRLGDRGASTYYAIVAALLDAWRPQLISVSSKPGEHLDQSAQRARS